MGGSLYVAQRLPRVHGTALIAAAGLFAGSPWTGSNIGAAVTLFAAAGIWWGLRGELAWWRTALAAAAGVAGGVVLVVIAHRYLTSAATHITTFSEHTGGIGGLWNKFVDRLGVGTDLIANNPFALLPVVGVLVMLIVVLRPPRVVGASFRDAPRVATRAPDDRRRAASWRTWSTTPARRRSVKGSRRRSPACSTCRYGGATA